MRTPRRLTLALALFVWWCPPLHAQGTWDAILNIDPYPSPYYSDWDIDPNIATLTVINTTQEAQQVRIHFNVTNHANKLVLSGSSDPQNVGAGATAIFDNPYDVAGTTHRDEEEDGVAARTGRLREGDYTACAVIADMSGFALAESCADFTIVYPDPPLLIGPENGEIVTQVDPLFQWTPVQVPVDFQLSYVMRVVEVLASQTPQEALRANIPHYQSLDGQFPSLRYPIDARPFETGKQYAWTVQVLDQNGYSAATNDGRSEIWTFRVEDEVVKRESPAGTFDLNVGFYDAESEDPPDLLKLIGEGKYTELVDYILTAARNGSLEIKLPMPALLQNVLPGGGGAGGTEFSDPFESGTPRGPAATSKYIFNVAGGRATSIDAACLSFLVPHARAAYDSTRKAIAVSASIVGTPVMSMLGCFGVSPWSMPQRIQDWELLFAVSWKEMPPRVIFAFKPPLFDLLENARISYAVFVVNLLGEYELSSEMLPTDFEDFFGEHKFEAWGPGAGEILRRFKAKITDKPAAGTLGNLLGVNFFSVVDFGPGGPLAQFADWVGIDPTIKLQGFTGSREKTFRGAGLSSDEGAELESERERDNWFLRASVPTRPPAWLPGVTARRFEIEVGSQDKSVGNVGLRGESDMRTQYRVLVRDVLSGFPNIKKLLGIEPDSTFEIFGEFKIEWNGNTTTAEPRWVRNEKGKTPFTPERTVVDTSSKWDHAKFVITYGTKAEIDLFGGYASLIDPKLVAQRSSETAQTRNPLKNLQLSLESDFGIAGHEVGEVEIEFKTKTAKQDTAKTMSASYAKLTRLKAEADSLEDVYWMRNEQLSEEVAKLPAGDTAAYNAAVRNDEILRVLMAEVRNVKRRSDEAKSAYAKELEKDPKAASKTEYSIGMTLKFEQGASIAGLLKLAKHVGTELWQ